MRLDLTPQPAYLARRQTFSLRTRKGQRIECRSGQLWITQDGDPRDVILVAEECFTLDRNGQTLVSALEDASFTLHNTATVSAASPALPSMHGTRTPNCCAY